MLDAFRRLAFCDEQAGGSVSRERRKALHVDSPLRAERGSGSSAGVEMVSPPTGRASHHINHNNQLHHSSDKKAVKAGSSPP
jgi:hypothetical protein